MKFNCLKCGEHQFSINARDMIDERITVRLYCPNCEAINEVSVDYIEGVEVRIVENHTIN